MKRTPRKISKETESILKPYHEDMKRYVGAISEQFKANMKLVGEQYKDIQKTLGSHGEILQSHGEILQSHGEILQSHGEILESHTEMIGKLLEDMNIVKTNVEFLKEGLKKKVDYDEFLALERRMSLLESKIK